MTSLRTTLLRSTLGLAAAAAAVVAAAAPGPAAAQTPAPTRVAIVNPVKVFNGMAETKALQARMVEEQKRYDNDVRTRTAKLAEMRKGLEDLKPDSPQWEAASQALMAESASVKVWAETERAKAEFNQRRQRRALFDKIQAAIAKVAQRDGIDLVVADYKALADVGDRPIEESDPQDPRSRANVIQQRNLLYVNPNKQGMDITAAVQLLLDAEFKAAGPAAGGNGGK